MEEEQAAPQSKQFELIQEIMAGVMGSWIPQRMYCKLYDETVNTINLRINRGAWVKGVHYSRPVGGSPWVNLVAVRAWVEAGK